jgi:DegV family protein with EDD domain
MPHVLIVTDSGAAFPDRAALGLGNLTIIPNRVTLHERTGYEGTDFTARELWEVARTQHGALQFAAPSAQEYYRLFQAGAAQFDAILSIHTSAQMSASFANAQRAAERLAGSCPIALIDSRTMSVSQGLVVQAAVAASRTAPNFDALVRYTRAVAARVFAIYYVESTEAMLANHMLTAEHSILSSMLGVKPMLTFDEGHLVTTGKARTRSQVVEQLIEFASGFDSVEQAVIVQPESAQRSETTRLLINRLADLFPGQPITLCSYSPSLAALIGAQAGGLVILSAEREETHDLYKD